MTDYRQPSFYRFNSDSLKLVTKVKDDVPSAASILDLGAGCGVIGIELARHFVPQRLELLELQPEYWPFLEQNIEAFLPAGTNVRLHSCSFGQWAPGAEFELVVCNPPYYLAGRGELSPNPQRARARSFLVDNWEILLRCFQMSLAPAGVGYLVVRGGAELLREVEGARAKLSLALKVESMGDLLFLRVSRLNKE